MSGFNIAVGAFYELGEKKVAEGSITTGAGSSSFTINQKGRFGAFVAPGAFIGSNTILYAKLSYNRAPGDISIANGGTSRTENFNGIGGGFGIKHLFGPNVFMFIEIEYIAYQSKNFSLGGQDSVTYKPKNAVGLLGVGYQF